jgi:uncharacterized protein DUF5916/cellulose/xylan binding protein with CBM9 domain
VRVSRVSALAAALFWLAPALARAQRATPAPAAVPAPSSRTGALGGRPTLTAVRATEPPAIDGRLDDTIWRSAALIDTFVQEEPQEGQPSTEKTEIRVAYDADKLYFGIYAHYSDVGLRRANRSDRDKLDDDDTVTIFLEPFLDYLRGYSFSVNGYGVQRDSLIVVTNAQDNPDGDLSYNALYYSGGQLVDDGWTAEMAIPIRSLRYPGRKPGEVNRWGFQVRRKITSKDERVVWAPVSRNVMSFLAQIGILDGITNLSTQRNFEVLPTFTAIGSGRLDAATGQFATDHVEEGGVGLKYGLSSNLTLDFTYNPDFSQIESDNQQLQVNNRFPINFPELRPFFLEGREIYETPGNPRVETRRIVDPRYAVKLTGKVGARTSVGLLIADDEAPGKVDSITDPAYGQTAKAVFGRLKYDLYRNSHVGLIVTNREFMNDYSRMVAGDLSLRIGQTRNFGFRYFKADSEENGVRKTGWASTVSIRQEGRNWRWQNFTETISPNFRNQLSFLQRVDQIKSMPNLSYRFWPESWILNWGPSFSVPNTFDFAGVLQDLSYNPGVSFSFAKNISFSAGYQRQMERFREIDFDKNGWNVSGSVSSSRRVSFSANYSDGGEIRFVTDPFLGRNREYGGTVTVRPSARLQSVLKVSTSRFIDDRTLDHTTIFDVKIIRSTTTYQFTPRLLLRSISEFNVGTGANHTVFQNLLATYRVNSGTVFYVGYDDRFKQGNAINNTVFFDAAYQRTNRAVFTKLQYLFRNGGNS